MGTRSKRQERLSDIWQRGGYPRPRGFVVATETDLIDTAVYTPWLVLGEPVALEPGDGEGFERPVVARFARKSDAVAWASAERKKAGR